MPLLLRESEMFTSKVENNIVILNVTGQDFITSLEKSVHDFFESENTFAGFVLNIAESDFLDLRLFKNVADVDECLAITRRIHRCFRIIEKSKKPVVAAINGTALSIALELALACHHNILLNSPDVKLGFPEVSFGLLPGGGGTQRLPRKIGFETAVPLMIDGNFISTEKALELKIVNEVAQSTDDLLIRAKDYISRNPSVQKLWDMPDFRIPGPAVQSPRGYQFFPAIAARLMEKTWMNYPAPQSIIKCVYEGLQLPFDQALELEQKYFAELVVSKTTKNMLKLSLSSDFYKAKSESAFTARVLKAYMTEGMAAQKEGLSPVLIENAAKAAGMIRGPLSSTEKCSSHAADKNISFEEMKLRLLTCQTLEAIRCIEEGVISSPEEGDVISVVECGFPAFTGGALSYVQFRGTNQFIKDCNAFEGKYGERFKLPASLLNHSS